MNVKKLKKNKKGFTLVEIIVVLVIHRYPDGAGSTGCYEVYQ